MNKPAVRGTILGCMLIYFFLKGGGGGFFRASLLGLHTASISLTQTVRGWCSADDDMLV